MNVVLCAGERPMRRREFITLLSCVAVARPSATIAQPVDKARRIGFLLPATAPTNRREVFVQGLSALGYVEGQNLLMEYRFASGDEGLAALAADLVRANVEVIVTSTTPLTLEGAPSRPICRSSTQRNSSW